MIDKLWADQISHVIKDVISYTTCSYANINKFKVD